MIGQSVWCEETFSQKDDVLLYKNGLVQVVQETKHFGIIPSYFKGIVKRIIQGENGHKFGVKIAA